MLLDGCLTKIFTLRIFFACFLVISGCDRMITPRSTQVLKDAETKVADADYLEAIILYESALDGSTKSADIHYRLALLYDDKMHDPFNALHHFKRYLTLAPNGPHANDAKRFMKKDEIDIATNLSGDSVVSRTEAARLKNENFTLHKELEDQKTRMSGAGTDKGASDPKSPQKVSPNAKTYVVKDGDTLASISRRFYKTSTKWKKILNANHGVIDDPAKLKAGQQLTIP
jgi:LysM repeat protein